MRLANVFAQVFDQPADSFSDDSSQENTLNWTSLQHVKLLVSIENGYEVRFSNVEMSTMRTLRDIREVLSNKGVPVT